MQMENYIVDLIRKHNCVIVPDFGGFIANYQPAYIDQSGKRIHPPFKSVIFNARLHQNDGLLAGEIAQKEGCSFEKAISTVKANVQRWKHELDQQHRVNIGDIGFLFKENDKICFEHSREVNLLLQAYGLTSVSFTTFDTDLKVETIANKKQIEKTADPIKKDVVVVAQDNAEDIKEPVIIRLDGASEIVEEDNQVIPIDSKSRKSGRWKYYGIAAALPLFFYAYWIPMETDFLDTGQIQFSDFNPIQSQHTKVYAERSDDPLSAEKNIEFSSWEELTAPLSDDVYLYNYEFSKDLYIPVRLSTDVVQSSQPEPVTQPAQSGNGWYIIGGCFSVKSNAENLVDELNQQGFSAYILDVNQELHRVTAGGYGDKDEAKTALDNLKSKGYSGWILKQ